MTEMGAKQKSKQTFRSPLCDEQSQQNHAIHQHVTRGAVEPLPSLGLP
jgi:hypothetical protein